MPNAIAKANRNVSEQSAKTEKLKNGRTERWEIEGSNKQDRCRATTSSTNSLIDRFRATSEFNA
jgi:hypothetical protein